MKLFNFSIVFVPHPLRSLPRVNRLTRTDLLGRDDEMQMLSYFLLRTYIASLTLINDEFTVTVALFVHVYICTNNYTISTIGTLRESAHAIHSIYTHTRVINNASSSSPLETLAFVPPSLCAEISASPRAQYRISQLIAILAIDNEHQIQY